MKSILKIVLGSLALYGLLYWASNNPKSVANIKDSIDETAKDVVDSLTDEK